MKLKILVVAGDGIGPEVTREAVKVLRSVAEVGGRDFQFAEALIGGAAIRAEGSPLPQKTLDKALASDAVLLTVLRHSLGERLDCSCLPNDTPVNPVFETQQLLPIFLGHGALPMFRIL